MGDMAGPVSCRRSCSTSVSSRITWCPHRHGMEASDGQQGRRGCSAEHYEPAVHLTPRRREGQSSGGLDRLMDYGRVTAVRWAALPLLLTLTRC